jgi:hypothetical protein
MDGQDAHRRLAAAAGTAAETLLSHEDNGLLTPNAPPATRPATTCTDFGRRG